MKYKSKPAAILFAAMTLYLPQPCMGEPAGDKEPPWVKCALLDSDKKLDCYDQTTKQYVANHQETSTAATLAAKDPAYVHDWKLDRLWPVGDEINDSKALAGLLLQYKRNYLMVDSIYAPSDAPTSPNPANQVPASSRPHPSELNLQVSVKARLPVIWPWWNDSMWVAYTQQSHWQAFNSGDSRPFRETDYEPELIFLSHRFGDWVPTLGNLTPRLANFAVVHQSNGQALPRSRSWNRLTAELGSEYRFDNDDDRRFTVMLRPWWRLPESPGDDDNPDIVKYLGHGDINFNYWHDRDQYSLMLRERAVKLDWSFPFSDSAPNSPNLHLQYFNGYGESLIDYNHKLHSFGVGISLPY